MERTDKKRRRPRFAALCAAALSLSLVSGCFMSPRTARTVGNLATAALWTAAIAGTLTTMAYHDSHFHYETCGHYRRYHDGRWVYYYGNRWEYYDEPSGGWYYYAE